MNSPFSDVRSEIEMKFSSKAQVYPDPLDLELNETNLNISISRYQSASVPTTTFRGLNCCDCKSTSVRCGNWTRRLVRLLFLCIVLGFIVGIIMLHFELSRETHVYEFDEDSVQVSAKDCTILLRRDESVSGLEVRVRAPDSGNIEESENELIIENTFGNTETCEVIITAESVFPQLSITCEHLCRIEQDEDDILYFNNGLSIISKTDEQEAFQQGRIKFKQIQVSTLSIDFMGTVTIKDLDIEEEASINVYLGDVWVKSQNNVDLKWSTYESDAYCMAGPYLEEVTEPECFNTEITITDSTTYEVDECVGQHKICKDKTCQNSVSASISAGSGNIYWHLVNSDGDLYENYDTIRGAQYLDVSFSGKIDLADVKNYTQGTELERDILVVMEWPGIMENEGKWLYTTNIAYAQMRPWWLSFFSLNLLLPEVREYHVRIVPYECPFVEPNTKEQTLGRVWSTLYDSFGRRETDHVIWMERSAVDDKWYDFSMDGQLQFTKTKVDFEDNPYLMGALAISLTLALGAGIGGAYLCLNFIKSSSERLWDRIEHIRRYNNVKKALEKREKDLLASDKEAAKSENEEEDPDDDQFLEEEEEALPEDEEAPGKGQLPPPYSIPDLLLVDLRNSSTNSLQYYLKQVVKRVNINEEVPAQVMTLISLKEKYEAFCFLNGYTEMDLKDNRDIFYAFGIEFFTLNDSSTEAFRRIRFKTRKEQIEQGKVHQMPNEDSLSYFVRARCEITPFTADLIYMRDFQASYDKFARAEKVSDPVPITKRAMESKGAIFERLQISALRASGDYRLDLDKMDELIENTDTSQFPANWLLYDFFSVVAHVILTGWIIIPLSLPAIYTEAKHAMISARDEDYILTYADLDFLWWNIPEKLHYMPGYFKAMLIISVSAVVISIIELVTYYLAQTFPFRTDTVMASITGFRKYCQYLYYITFSFVVGWIFFYVILGLCWFILGAVLNPDTYLPYATAAITVITFCIAQVQMINTIRTEVMKRIKTMVWEKLRSLMVDTVNNVASDLENESQGIISTTQENKTLELFVKTPLGKIAGELEIDPRLALALIAQEDDAINELSESLGMKPELLAAIVTVIMKDQKKLLREVFKLSKIPGIQINSKLAQLIINLAWRQSDINIRSTVKASSLLFTHLRTKNITDPEFDYTIYDIDSRIVEALVAMSRGSVERLLDLIVKSAAFPDNSITDMLFLIKGLTSNEIPTETFVTLLTRFVGLPEEIARGFGALCDESYALQFGEDFSGYDNNIDAICDILRIPESMPVHMMVHMARSTQENMQRLLGQVIEYLNSKMIWTLDRKIISSLLIGINGVTINIENLANKYKIEPEAAESIAWIFSEKKYAEIHRAQVEQREIIEPSDHITKGEEAPLIDVRTESGTSSATSAQIDIKQAEELSPSLAALLQSHQPNSSSMEWMAQHFKLTGEQLLGLYAMLRGPNGSHTDALKAITQEIMRRMGIDESFINIVSHITIWATSLDSKAIKTSQAALKMHFNDLTFVAKRLVDPKDLPNGYLSSTLGFAENDPLVRRRATLSWSTDSELCKEWCKTAAIRIMENKKISTSRKVIGRGQLLISIQYPHLYIKHLLQKHTQADEEMVRKYKSLVNAAWIWQMQGSRRRDAIVDLARVLDIDIPMMKAWVNMVIEDDLDKKLEAMKAWLKEIGMEDGMPEKTEKLIKDFCNQESLYFDALYGFQNLGQIIGVPSSFIRVVAPGMLGHIQAYDSIFEKFIKDFAVDLGLNISSIQDSLVKFIKGKAEDLEPLGRAFGIKSGVFSHAINMFGRLPSASIVDSIGTLLEKIGIPDNHINIFKAVSALAQSTTKPFTVHKPDSLPSTQNAAEVLSEMTGIPRLIIEGMLCAKRNLYEDMRVILIELSRQRLNAFRIEENLCRGFISMVKGQLANIEDVSLALKFDADVAEVLVSISGNQTLNHTNMKTSTQFQKIAVRLGIDESKLAALIALTKGDLEHANQIVEDLDENESFPVQFIKLCLAVHRDTPKKGLQYDNYNPTKKAFLIKKYISWLCKLFNLNKAGAELMIRLVQGEMSVISEIYDSMGWTGQQRGYYSALACLINQAPLVDYMESQDPFAWMAYKHKPNISQRLANLFKTNRTTIEFLISISRKELEALYWIRQKCKLQNLKDVTQFLESVIYEGEVDGDEIDDDLDIDIDSDTMSDSGSVFTDKQLEDSDAEAPIINLSNKSYSNYVKMFEELVKEINKLGLDSSEQVQLDVKTAKLILSLGMGSIKQIHLFEEVLHKLYENNPPINLITTRELLAIASGKIANMQQAQIMNDEYYEPDVRVFDLEHSDRNTEIDKHSLFKQFGIDPRQPNTHFLIKFASGDDRCWDLISQNGQAYYVKVHSNCSLVKGLMALCTHNTEGVFRNIGAVAEFCDIDPDMTLILIMISFNYLDELASGITPLALRLDVDPSLATAFIPKCFHNRELLESALQAACERMTIPPTNTSLVASILMGCKGDVNAWIHLGQLVLNITKQSEIDTREEVSIMKAIDLIISGKWHVGLLTEQFNKSSGLGGFSLIHKDSVVEIPYWEKQKNRIVNLLKLQDLENNSIMRALVPVYNQGLIPRILFDLVVSISYKNIDSVPILLSILKVPENQYSLITALIQLFNVNNAVISKSVNTIEEYIRSHNCLIPPGLIQTMIGGLRDYASIVAEGLERCADHLKDTSPWASKYNPIIPEIIFAMIQKKLFKDYKLYVEDIPIFIQRLTGVKSDPNHSRVKLLLAILMDDEKAFIRESSKDFMIPEEVMMDLYTMCVPGTPEEATKLKWISTKLNEIYKNIPADVLQASLLLLSNSVENLDEGRDGMGTYLYRMMRFMVNKLTPDLKIQNIKPNEKEVQELHSDEPAEIKVMDSIFLSLTDANKYKEFILAGIPTLGRALMPNVHKDTLTLLYGLVSLFQSDGDVKYRKLSIQKLAKAFRAEGKIITGLVCLAKGDWENLHNFASRIGEYDADAITKLSTLLRRLKIITESENESASQQKHAIQKLKEKIDMGADAEQIFHMLDVDGSGLLDYEEFTEVMKFFNLRFTQERLLELFARFDDDGSCEMNLEEFDAALNFIRQEISEGAMNQLGLSRRKLARMFIVSLSILLFLFAFIFMGIIGFIGVSRFGTGVNSMLPVTAGGVVGKLRMTHNLEYIMEEISRKIQKVLAIITINEASS